MLGLGRHMACPLCLKRETLEHILNCCTKILGEGWYKGRHGQILKAIAGLISAGVEQAKKTQPLKQTINFFRAGEEPRPSMRMKATLERKLTKNDGLVSESPQGGWRVRYLPIKVGCRGFAA